MKIIKKITYFFLILFLLFTIYKVVLIYVFNISSLKSSFIYHSKSIEISRNKGLYITEYRLNKETSSHRLSDTLIPGILFIEKEKIIYPQYYFYWGKSEIGNRSTMDATNFLTLSNSGEYDISCPISTLPNENENIDKYRKDIYFFFDNVPSKITFLIKNRINKSEVDSLIYTKL